MILFKDNIFKGTNVILKNIPKKTVMQRGYMKPLSSCDGSHFMRKWPVLHQINFTISNPFHLYTSKDLHWTHQEIPHMCPFAQAVYAADIMTTITMEPFQVNFHQLWEEDIFLWCSLYQPSL